MDENFTGTTAMLGDTTSGSITITPQPEYYFGPKGEIYPETLNANPTQEQEIQWRVKSIELAIEIFGKETIEAEVFAAGLEDIYNYVRYGIPLHWTRINQARGIED